MSGLECWLSGTFLPVEEAAVGAFDAGFQHGVGLFETMRAANGRVFRLQQHLERLAESARSLRLTESLRVSALAQAVQATIERNNLKDARVRLTLSGGRLDLRTDQPGRSDPTILIHAQPATAYPEELLRDGITVVVNDDRVSPFDSQAGHKTLAYWGRLSALQAAGAKGAAEALWFTVTNHLCGGCTSNVFLVRDGVLLTPPARGEEDTGSIPSPVLPGVTRAVVLEVARSEGIAVETKLLTIVDLLDAEECFLTNSGWGLLPVVRVEAKDIGAGNPGEVFSMLRSGYEALVEQETAYDLSVD